MKMKASKLFIWFFVLQALLVIPALPTMVGYPVSSQSQANDREQKRTVDPADLWALKGIEFFEKKEYSKAIECFRKAAKLKPSDFSYAIILPFAYREAGKYEEARQLLEESLKKFPGKEDRKKLQIELSKVHFQWAERLRKKYDHANAIMHYGKAYAIDEVYRPKDAAIDLNKVGLVYFTLGRNQKALDCFEKVLSINRAVGDRAGEATTINNIGAVYSHLGQKQKALDYYEKALQIKRLLGNRDGEATTLNNIGNVYSDLGRNQEARACYEKALQIHKGVGNRAGEATSLNNIGTVSCSLGQNQKALGYFGKALTIYRAVGDRSGEATTLNNIGNVYSDLGRNQEARACYEKALQIHKGVGNRAGEATSLNNIGTVSCSLGQNQKALEYFGKSLTIYRAVGDRAGEATTLNNIGTVSCSLGQNQKALEYYEKALTILRAVGDRAGEATILNNIGKVYDDLGQNQKALDYYGKALTIYRAVGDRSGEATTLNNIGKVYEDLGRNQKALDYYEKALQIHKAVGGRAEEATTLNNIGTVSCSLGQNQKALEYYEKALTILRAVGDRAVEATTLNNIGKVYDDLGQNQKALDYYEKALQIHKAVGDRAGEATTLNNIGKVYDDLGLKQKALEYYEKVLSIVQVIGYRDGEARTLGNIGRVYNDLGQKQKALDYYEKALPIFRAVGDRAGKAATLHNIGTVHNILGLNQKALEYYEKALPIIRAVGNRTGEATTLNNIGNVYSDLGQKQKALEYYEKALPIFRAVGARAGEATTLNNIGKGYADLGQKQKALEYYEKALPIFRAVGARAGEATTLNNIGTVYNALGQKQKALDYYEKALPILMAVGNHAGEANSLSNIMVCLNSLKNTHLSIYYGKRSVNAYQSLRAFITGLKKETQKSYLETKKHTYRDLAYLLISEGRISEARSVLDLLKIQEYRDFIRSSPPSADLLSALIDFTLFEEQWLKKYNTHMDKLTGISNEYHALTFKKNKNDAEKKRMKELGSQLEKETKAYQEYLAQMKNAFDKHEREIKEGKLAPDTLAKKARQLQDTLKYLDENENNKHAALHFLVFGNRITVIITTASAQVVKQTEIDQEEFNRLVMNYRNFILKSGKERQAAKELYDIIFKPVDEELRNPVSGPTYSRVTTLTVSLDGVLRYIPLGTLWDGEHYLAQRYRIAVITPSSLKNIKAAPLHNKKILGLGASRGGHGFDRLPNVRSEIQAIVNDKEKNYNGLIQGKAFLDHYFTKDTMLKELNNKNYPLVHISSHFKFSPGEERKNFLLLGDGTILTLTEISKMGKLFDNVKLLVLSACQTGVGGNGEEIDGFGELAQQSGAQSVVASLWSVNDKSTKDLMVAFYRILKEGNVTGKIEALRQAQLELAGLEDLLQKNKSQKIRQKSKYSHPYYWGPFIMMGNWR